MYIGIQNASLHIQMLQSECQKAGHHREYILVEILLPVLVEDLSN